MNMNFGNYEEQVVTFKCEHEENIYMGTPVKMSRSGIVTACGDGDNMIGVAVNVRNGYAAVQLTGYIEMPVDDNFTFDVGYKKICVGAGGKVKLSSKGREYLVVHVEKGIVGFIL